MLLGHLFSYQLDFHNKAYALLNVTNTIGLRLVSLYKKDLTAPAISFSASRPPPLTMSMMRRRIMDIVNGGGLDAEKDIAGAVKSFLYNETKRRPMVFVTLSKA